MTQNISARDAADILTRGLTPDVDVDTAALAVADVLTRRNYFNGMSPVATDGVKTFNAFCVLLDLAGLPANHVSLAGWVALRAMRPEPGERIDITLSCPIILALARRLGAVVVKGGRVLADGTGPADAIRIVSGKTPSGSDTALVTPAGTIVIPDAGLGVVRGGWAAQIEAASKVPGANGRTAYTASPDATVELPWIAVDNRPAVDADAVHEDWTPEIATHEDLKAHPAPLIQSATLATVSPPECHHRPRLSRRVIQSGLISDAQFEFLVAAGTAHSRQLPPAVEDEHARPRRAGFYLADGTGAGKTNSLLGAILDNRLHGRRRAILVLAKTVHFGGYQETWQRFGRSPNDLIEHWNLKGDPIPNRDGILVTTYSQIRQMAPDGSFPKLEQIVEWAGAEFSGILAFDEAQEMRNAAGSENMSGKTSDTSRQGLAGLELQQRLHDARVIYASATGATDVHNLAYADRLGLWGTGTAFPERIDFIQKFEAGGVADLEQVTLSLKALGLYMSRGLSFEGVEIEHLPITMTVEERRIYNEAADLWKELHSAIPYLRELCGLPRDSQTAAHWRQKRDISHSIPHSGLTGMFESDRKASMSTLIASFKTRGVIDAVRARVEAGHHVVIQMQNTYEAQLERAIARGDDISKITLEPSEMVDFAMKLPVTKYEIVNEQDAKGRLIRVYKQVLDAAGNPVEVQAAVAHRNMLLAKARSMVLPLPPLDQILLTFGADRVAEVTGRSNRLVPDRAGGRDRGATGVLLESRTKDQRLADIKAFHDNRKQILVFSTGAGGSSLSYHARTGTPAADRRRVHYLIQLGHRADEVTQGIGRTHRSDQASAPLVSLVSLDLPADQLYASRIVSALFKLGALTQGHRHATSNGMFDERDQMDGPYAQRAWKALQADIEQGLVPGYSWENFMSDLGLSHSGDATVMKWNKETSVHALTDVNRLINRVAALGDRKQMLIFDALRAKIDEQIEVAIKDGTFNAGPEVLKAASIEVLSEQTIYTDPIHRGETKLLRLRRVTTRKFTDFKDALRAYHRVQRYTGGQFVKHQTTGAVALILPARSRESLLGIPIPMVEVITPTGSEVKFKRIVDRENWIRYSAMDENLEKAWTATIEGAQQETVSYLTLATGSLLPLWNALSDASESRHAIWRVKTDEGQAYAARPLSPRHAVALIEELGRDPCPSDAELAEIVEQLRAGNDIGLTLPGNGAHRLSATFSAGEISRMSLTFWSIGSDPALEGFLMGLGCVQKPLTPQGAWIISPPAGEGEAILARLLAIAPAFYVEELTGKNQPQSKAPSASSVAGSPAPFFAAP